MGLDIFFRRVKKGKDPHSKQLFSSTDVYVRKNNWLLPFFNYGENLSAKEITKDDIDRFVNTVDEICKSNSRVLAASEKLPVRDGFFFGSTSYDEDYFKAIKNNARRLKTLASHTDFDKQSIYMICWW